MCADEFENRCLEALAQVDALKLRVIEWRFVTDILRQRRQRAYHHYLARRHWRVVMMAPPSDMPLH